MFTTPYLYQGAYRSADHVPQEAVGRNAEVPIGMRFLDFAFGSARNDRGGVGSARNDRGGTRNDRGGARNDREVRGRIRPPEGVEDGADGGFVVRAGFLEAGEVVGAKEIPSGLVHGVKIQGGIGALPTPWSHERVFLPVNEVGIFTAAGAEPRMEIIGHGKDLMNHHGTGQNGI